MKFSNNYNFLFSAYGPGGGGGGDTEIFSYFIHTSARVIFCVQNFEFQYFLGFSEKEYFWGHEDFVDIFWGHHKIGPYLGVISMRFRVFS